MGSLLLLSVGAAGGIAACRLLRLVLERRAPAPPGPCPGDPEQQVNVQAMVTLSLPLAWEPEHIAAHIRARIGEAFKADLPGSAADPSLLSFDFQEEAEIYGIEG